ncbi:MAG: hypothetical protein ACPL5I_16745 [Thermodesulfobacteriota bacterium]
MTHTLHRRGDERSLSEDYVLLVMPARGYNLEGSSEKMKKVFEIISHYKTVNFGNARVGNSHRTTIDKLMTAENQRIAHAVFSDRENLLACLKELKEKDLGISVVVSGLYDHVVQCCHSIGLKPHTVNNSLETLGAVEKLPQQEVLEIITMCGHAMVSPDLVKHLLEEVQEGKRSLEEAAVELSRLCDCGVFNPARAAKIMKKMLNGKK